MRFVKYIYKSILDDDDNKFRFLDIKLVDKETGHKNIIHKVSEKYGIDKSALYLVESLNKELKKCYTGKFQFDFVLSEGILVDDIKIPNKKILEKIRMKYFQINEELNKVKSDFESYLRKVHLQSSENDV